MAYDENTPFALIPIIEAMFGEAAAMEAAITLSGRRVYIPKAVGKIKGPISKVLSSEQIATLGAEVGGIQFEVPRSFAVAARDRKIADMRREGVFVGDIAAAVGLSDRRVWQICQRDQLKGRAPWPAARHRP